MVFIFRTVLLAAMALTFFGQQGLGMAVERSTGEPSMADLDKRAHAPEKYGNVVGAVTVGKLDNDNQIKTVAASELKAYMEYIQTNKLAESAGITVYMKPDLRKIIVAAIGAGSGMHGEQNVKAICEAEKIEFKGGDIFTYTHQYGFITACGEPDETNTNRRNCKGLLKDADINDIAGRLK